MAGTVRGVAGPPLGRTAEIPCSNQAFLFHGFHLFKLLAAFEIGGLAGHNPVPGNTPECHFTNSDRCGFCKKAGHLLVTAPV